jgi:hypothetical protein
MIGADQVAAEINFFKIVSIMSGLFLLYITAQGISRWKICSRLIPGTRTDRGSLIKDRHH